MAEPLHDETRQLAQRHGLHLQGDIQFNEQGLDYRVAMAQDTEGQSWVLRIPRRPAVFPKMEYEAKVLKLVKPRVGFLVPDWRIVSPELVAYPRLMDPTALSFEATTYEVTWHIDQTSPRYSETLAKALFELHRIPEADVSAAGLRILSPETTRRETLATLERVKRELGIKDELERSWRVWLDDDTQWPTHACLIHGDLYAGHITADASSRLTGIIDWSEAEISDPSLDFAGHLQAFDLASLETLVALYDRLGGRTWPGMLKQIQSRVSASTLRYALFALETQSPDHLAAVKAQLGVS